MESTGTEESGHEPLAALVARHVSAARRRRVHHDLARRRGGRRPQRAQHRAVDLAHCLRAVDRAVGRVRPLDRGLPVCRARPLDHDRRLCDQLSHGDRRHLAVLRLAVDAADRALRRRELDQRACPGPRIHDRLPRPRNDDGRHFLCARFRAVLCFLRGRAGPDVPDHRGVGRAAAGLRGVQVLPLHAARLGIVIAGDPRGLFQHRPAHHRHHRGADPQFSARPAEMAVSRLPRLVRGQGADVAGAHLAARRACRGADSRVGDPRRSAVEDGRLRVHPVLVADVPARRGLFHPADVRLERDRGDLHLVCRARADRHEKADRLFLDRPYGLCDDGDFRADQRGGAGRDDPDAEPWPRLGRAVPVRRGRL